jgi:hypothetical protein
VYRYRLVNEADGADLGPLVSARLTFASGEMIQRGAKIFQVVRVVEPESENFRAYVIVRTETSQEGLPLMRPG